MGYIITYKQWQPYELIQDKRGFISRRYGNGHTGIDSVGNEFANPVCAIFDGAVTSVRWDAGLGNVVEYGSKNGRVKVAYYHLAKADTTVGRAVKKNERVGVEGATGSLATGKHLHTSLWIDGALTDPEPYLSGAKALPLGETEEETAMKYNVGDTVKVTGKIAPSAYSKAGTVTRTDALTITKIYEGTNFPYQLGVVGFTREQDMVLVSSSAGSVPRAQYDAVVSENAALKAKIEAAQAALR